MALHGCGVATLPCLASEGALPVAAILPRRENMSVCRYLLDPNECVELSFRTSSRRVVSKVVEGDQAARDLRRVRTFFVLHCNHVDATRPRDPDTRYAISGATRLSVPAWKTVTM